MDSGTMTIEQQNRLKIQEAIEGLDLTIEEQRTFNWLAGTAFHTVDSIVSVIHKARSAAQVVHE